MWISGWLMELRITDSWTEADSENVQVLLLDTFCFDHHSDFSSSRFPPSNLTDSPCPQFAGSIPPPPPPPRASESARQSSLQRHHVARLPVLTTNLPAVQAVDSLLTPLSATSLSSPFHQSSSRPNSRGVSPMAARSTAYNVPYNPSQWASGSRRTSQNNDPNAQVANPEDGIPAPPPPYSPPRNREPRSILGSATISSPADSMFALQSQSQSNTPLHSGEAFPSPPNRDSLNLSVFTQPAKSTGFLPPPPERRPGLNVRQSLPANKSRPISIASFPQVANLQFQYHPALAARTHVFDEQGAPAARRAASAGAVVANDSSSQSRDNSKSRSSSRHSSWMPGMPLPGPPPGPPLASSRSQSANAASDSSRKTSPGPSIQSTAHRTPLRVPMLSPMPPTPAGWIDEPVVRSHQKQIAPLHIQTTNLSGSPYAVRHFSEPSVQSEMPPGSSGALARSAAVKDSPARGLRERRTLRRSLQERDFAELSALTVNTNPWVEATSAATNRSPSGLSDVPVYLSQNQASSASPDFGASTAKVPAESTDVSHTDTTDMHPPTNTGNNIGRQLAATSGFESVLSRPLKALPTPPLSQKAPASAQSLRQASALPLNRRDIEDGEGIMADSLRRHQEFLMEERGATSELEQLRIFSEYIIAESNLRRARCAAVFNSGQFDPDDVRLKLFAAPLASNENLNGLSTTSATIETPISDANNDTKNRPESMWWKDYHPALSPIESHDEMSSRGRTSSRWWDSQGGSQTEGTQRLRRSKRESKYMGLSAALINSSILEDRTPTFPVHANLPTEQYPQEKENPAAFGLYEDADSYLPHNSATHLTSAGLIDISRLITLPPPYPRHYPAVSNCHPLLASYRTAVRTLSDISVVKERKARQRTGAEVLRKEHELRLLNNRKAFKSNIQEQVTAGTITYTEAAEAEEAMSMEEHQSERKCLKAEFDMLQDMVINPVHDLLNDRVVKLSAYISEITQKLFHDSRQQDPDQVQQEGDATPELLEYLTQLKWMFDLREQMYREIFDLLSDRNNRYRAIVVLPYRQANLQDKIRDTESFFDQDSIERRKAFCQDALQRHEQFHNVIDDNVGRGVQVQSSAFWDIAPSLAMLLHNMPGNVEDLGSIAIPDSEYQENPLYHRFPQQYLYSLLNHAEKSTYQFLESQINLQCLLHEVKSSLLSAKCRLMDINTTKPRTGILSDDPTVREFRTMEDSQLTTELKQKVGMIEEQWLESLGNQLQERKQQVKVYLEEQGGWEEFDMAAE